MTAFAYAFLSAEQRQSIKAELEQYRETTESSEYLLDKKKDDIETINTQIDASLQQFKEHKQSTQDYSQKLEAAKTKAIDIQKELEYYELIEADVQKKIDAMSFQKAQKQKLIDKVEEKKRRLNIALDAYRAEAGSLFQTFQTSGDVFDRAYTENLLSFIFSEDYLSKDVTMRKAFSSIEVKGAEILQTLEEIQSMLDLENARIESERKKFEDLEATLLRQQEYLQMQKKSYETLLITLSVSQDEYQKKWQESLSAMEDSADLIFSLEESSAELQQEIKKLEQQSVSQKTRFQWPIAPDLGISAFFKDAEYRQRFGIDHNAIDIPVEQGSIVTAPAAGYVYKVVDNGYGYSYVILLHSDDFKTVYGHISEFLVSEGESVQQGDPIAKSGGGIGTKGAGTLTTGPHLHFEVIEKQSYVNPLQYLPKL